MSSLIAKYERFLIENVETVATLENSLRTLLFFMPGRLRDSEVKLEVAYSAIGLLSWFNDVIIVDFLQKLQQKQNSVDNHHAKGQNANAIVEIPPKNCLPYAKWLTCIRFVELLIEMFAKQRWGTNGKYKAALFVEVFKSIVKLLLLRSTNKTLIQNYTVLPQFRDAATLKTLILSALQQKTNKDGKKVRDRLAVSPNKWMQFKAHTSNDPNAMNSEAVQRPEKSSTGKTIAEILHIIRPVVYLMSVLRFGERSWLPLLASLGVDLSSLGYYWTRVDQLTEKQQYEVTRRSLLLFYYLMRNPLFESFTLKTLGKPTPADQKQSMFRWMLSSLRSYITAYQEHYFYTSAT